MLSDGITASSTQVRRQRGGCWRLARTPRVRKKAKDAELCPLGKLKLLSGSASTSGRARANRVFRVWLASAVPTRVPMAKMAGRHCRVSRRIPPSSAPAMNWVRKSPSRVTTTITGFRSALRCSWTSVIRPWSRSWRYGQATVIASSRTRLSAAATAVAQRLRRRLAWTTTPTSTARQAATIPASLQKPSGNGRRRAAPVAQPGNR